MSEQPEGLAEAIGTDPAVDVTGETSGDGVGRESYHGYSVDDEDQPQSTGDSLTDNRGLANPLDEGYSPPEKWSAGQGYGNTPLEEAMGESLDQRLVQEVPEADPYQEAEETPVSVIEGDLEDEVTEVGDERAGRLVAPDEGVHTDTEPLAYADDVGVDGAGAGAEEAAMHVIDEDQVQQ
jgi:Family of unknown function (DUF5709)